MAENLQQQTGKTLTVNMDQDPSPTKVQSLCSKCGKNGTTLLLMTNIPLFKEILISSFSCFECGDKNNDVQFVGELPTKGIDISFKVKDNNDLNREIVKSQFASIKFQELGLEIPEFRAQINTVEGILTNVEKDLEFGQEQRKESDPIAYEKVNKFINKIKDFREGKVLPFTLKVHDPSGNSTVKNPFAPKLDDRIFISYFTRSNQDLKKMGFAVPEAMPEMSENNVKKVDFTQGISDTDFMHNEPSIIEIDCHACLMPGEMKLCQTNIPHFSDLVIMSFSCDYCGAHSTETKNSGAIGDKCTSITLKSKGESDLKRDLFKSQTCNLKIPEIQLELDYGTLGGVYTTVEGLLEKIQNHMKQINPFTDSDDDLAQRMKNIIQTLLDMREGRKQFTMIMEDPLSNSFLQNPYHPQQDKNAIILKRDRTQDQLDYLGINEMSV